MTAAGLRRAGRYGDPTGGRATTTPRRSFQGALAQFADAYPGVPLVSAAWDTRDHWIPWTLFALLYGEIGRVYAVRRLNAAKGAAGGLALGFSKATDPVPPGIGADLREAFE